MDGLVHERRKSSALAMELRISCTKYPTLFKDELYESILEWKFVF